MSDMEKKSSVLQIRLSEAEKQLLEMVAESNGLSVSAFVRLALLNANLLAVPALLKRSHPVDRPSTAARRAKKKTR